MLENDILFNTSFTIAKELFKCTTYPWEVISSIGQFITCLGQSLPADEYDHPSPTVWIAKDAVVFDSVYLGQNIIIDHCANITHCAYLRENVIVGKNALVGNSTELKNCILFDEVQVPHFNYVGDSVFGHKSHMGAGAVASNFRQDKQKVVIKNGDECIETGLNKLGAILGDNVEVGCNSVLNPGTVVLPNTNIYPLSFVRGVVRGSSIYKNQDNIVTKSNI